MMKWMHGYGAAKAVPSTPRPSNFEPEKKPSPKISKRKGYHILIRFTDGNLESIVSENEPEPWTDGLRLMDIDDVDGTRHIITMNHVKELLVESAVECAECGALIVPNIDEWALDGIITHRNRYCPKCRKQIYLEDELYSCKA